MDSIDDVQLRLDSYKTNKQRRQRRKEIHRIFQEGGDYAHMLIAVEDFALRARLEAKYKMTAKEAADDMYAGAAGGSLRLSVDLDGEHRTIPPEVFKRPH